MEDREQVNDYKILYWKDTKGTGGKIRLDEAKLISVRRADSGRYMYRGESFGEHMLGGGENDELRGRGGNDTLVGGPGDDSLIGGTGDDWISGGTGDDWLSGGAGDDLLKGGRGNDWLFGRAGDDTLHGGDGNDRLYGAGGNDRLHGGAGNDRLVERSGNGFLHGNSGDDELFGGAGRDILHGGAGKDILHGDGGNDTLRGNSGKDELTGGAGNDRYLFARGDGADTIDNADSKRARDRLEFQSGVNHDQLWFEKDGQDLVISVIGTKSRVTVEGWFSNADNRHLAIESGDGRTLALDSQIGNLVEAMAAFDPPAHGTTELPAAVRETLESAIADNWQT